MWLTIVFGYCALAWIIALAMAFAWAHQFVATAAVRGVSPLKFQIATVLVAPLAMPLVVWTVAQTLVARARRLRQLRKCLTTVREYEFASVNSMHLADSIRLTF